VEALQKTSMRNGNKQKAVDFSRGRINPGTKTKKKKTSNKKKKKLNTLEKMATGPNQLDEIV